MHPLTLPSRRERLSQSKPPFASCDCTHEYSPEHFIKVCALVEVAADTPNNELFAYRWLRLSWPLEAIV
jgi:hypothetical protein